MRKSTSQNFFNQNIPGLNTHAYTTGYNHGSSPMGDPFNDAIDCFPFTLNKAANEHYGKGYKEGSLFYKNNK